MARRRHLLPAVIAAVALLVPTSPAATEVPLAHLSGTGLSGTLEDYGHSLTWSVSGASPAPADLAEEYDGVVTPGAAVTFSGSATYSRGESSWTTNLSQGATLSGTDGVEFFERVGEGTYTLPFSLYTTAPNATADAKKGDVISSISASAWSFNGGDPAVGGPGVSVNLRLAVVVAPSDTVEPKISLKKRKKIYADIGKKRAERHKNVARFPLKLTFRMSDDSGKARGTVRVYSAGTAIGGASTKKFVKEGRYSITLKKVPAGSGPFFWCAQAEDRAGNYSPIKCRWLSIAVPISRANVNGCGTAAYGRAVEWLQNYFGNVRVYGTGADRTKVKIRNACNTHDAAYVGATIYDVIDKRYVDFRQWSRLRIDKKFRADIRTLCRRKLGSPKRMRPFLRTCENGMGLTSLLVRIPLKGFDALEDAGANTYFEMVREYGAVGFDADATTAGNQAEMPGRTFPRGGSRDNR